MADEQNQQQQQQNNQQQQQQQPAPPWYEGKVDPEVIGLWDNKGWDRNDPVKVALGATTMARELQRYHGVPPEQLLKLPKDAADEAGWKGVYSRLGVPGEAKEYDLSSIKFGDGTALEDGFTASMRDALHAARVPKDRAPDVVKAVVKYLDDADKADAAERTAKVTTEQGELRKNWGNNWEFNRLTAMQGARRLGVSDEEFGQFEKIPGGARMLEMFRRVGASTTEDTFVQGGQGGAGNPTTVEGAIAEKAELMRDDGFVARYTKGDAEAVRRMQGLNRMIAAAMPPAAA